MYSGVIDFSTAVSDHKGVYVTLANSVNLQRSYTRKCWLIYSPKKETHRLIEILNFLLIDSR